LTPHLNRTDAWLLGALTDTRKSAKPAQLWEFVNRADWLNRAIPTFDEVRFSLPRLAAAGLVMLDRDGAGRLTLKATEPAFEIRSRVRDRTLGGALGDLAALVGAQPYPVDEHEDRSLGPLEGFEEAEWDQAVTKNADWMTRAVRRFLPGYTAPGSSRDSRKR